MKCIEIKAVKAFIALKKLTGWFQWCKMKGQIRGGG
jgi:hypothetical protein